MSPGWRADGPEGWSWNTAQDRGWPNQSAAGWGIGDAGWGGVTETNVGDANQRDDQDMVIAEPTGWGNDNGWGVSTATNNQYKAEVERKTSISSTRALDPPPISPREDPRRSLTLDLHISVRYFLFFFSRASH
jgi:hypothetical protein